MSTTTLRPRRGKPSTTYTYNDHLVGQVELRADASGLIRIRSAAEDRAAEGLHLKRTKAPTKPEVTTKPVTTPSAVAPADQED